MSAILNEENYYEVIKMIIPIKGKVTYSITLDPSVWIFDDRKIELEHAFTNKAISEGKKDDIEQASKRWDSEVTDKAKPPVNRSIKRFEREKILKSSYVMPIDDFLNHAQIKEDATEAILIRSGENAVIPLADLYKSYLLFSKDGKPLKDDGPVHLYYKDGSNKDNPITNIAGITIQ